MTGIAWAYLAFGLWIVGGYVLAWGFWKYGPPWLTGRDQTRLEFRLAPRTVRRRFYRKIVGLWPFATIWLGLRTVEEFCSVASDVCERRWTQELRSSERNPVAFWAWLLGLLAAYPIKELSRHCADALGRKLEVETRRINQFR